VNSKGFRVDSRRVATVKPRPKVAKLDFQIRRIALAERRRERDRAQAVLRAVLTDDRIFEQYRERVQP
jgi:hypothetical protein